MMKKKIYLMPTTELVWIVAESQVLAESPVGPSPAPAANALRNSYGEEENLVW